MKKSIASNLKHFAILSLVILFCLHGNAQDSTKRFRNMVFKTTVYNMDEKMIGNGYLVQVNDSNVVLSYSPYPFSFSFGNQVPLNQINYNEIEYIQYKRKGSVGRGIVAGILGGAALGAIVGLASGDDKVEEGVWLSGLFAMSAGEKAASYGVVFGLLGGITGAIIGAVASKKFIINGKPSALKELNTSLLERVYSK